MIALLLSVAHAGCCTTTGVEPLALASCERLAVVATTDLEVRTGHHGWDGAWTASRGTRLGTWTTAVGVVGRATKWLVLGLRAPVSFELDRDGKTSVDLGVGPIYPWLGVEATIGGLRPGWMAALGSDGTGARALETGPIAMWTHGAAFVAGSAIVGVPFASDGAWTGRGTLTAGVGRRAQVGGRVEWDQAVPIGAGGWALRSEGLRIGPALWAPLGPGRAELALVASPPLPYGGRNQPSSVSVSFGWLAAVAR